MVKLIDYLIKNKFLIPDSKGHLILRGNYSYDRDNMDCTEREYLRTLNLLKDLIILQVGIIDDKVILNNQDYDESQRYAKEFENATNEPLYFIDGNSCVDFNAHNIFSFKKLRAALQNIVQEGIDEMKDSIIIDRLNKLDSGEDYYDLRNMYEAYNANLTAQDKQTLTKMIQTTNDPKAVYYYLQGKMAQKKNPQASKMIGEDLGNDSRDMAEEFMQYAKDNGWYGAWELFEYSDNSFTIEVTWGDWKHEHLFLDKLAEQFFAEKNMDVEISQHVTEEDGSDTYTANHVYEYTPIDIEESYDDLVKPKKVKFKKNPKGAILPHADIDKEMDRFNHSTREITAPDGGVSAPGADAGAAGASV